MSLRLTQVILTAAVVLLLGVATAAAWTVDEASNSRGIEPVSGAALFLSKGCVGCHSGPDASSTINIGPDLSALATTAAERRPDMTAEDYVRESILSPQAFTVAGFGAQMPTLQLAPDEIEALVTYLLNQD